MKLKITFLLLCAVLFTYAMAFAQVQKGDANLGVNASYSTITGVDTDNGQGTFVFTYQKYVSDNLSLGAGPLYIWNTSDDVFSQIFGLNLFMNYSFLSSNGTTLPYLGLQYSSLIITTESDSDYFENRSGALGANAGVKFFFTERVNFDANLSYTTIIAASTDTGSGLEDTDAEGGILQFTIGLGVIIGKKGS
ncbi:MAG: outer membrane beta-barrel protein [Fulvivirga sp.]|uniref:outer membrane beta-barrel protein n=1 Tax=Fulvivirga sp. TaxID=1931237 RepID=UPI0032ECCC9B